MGCTLVYLPLSGMAPAYLAANRVYLIVGPRTWNHLLYDVTSSEWLSTFCQRRKTHRLQNPFSDYNPGLDFT